MRAGRAAGVTVRGELEPAGAVGVAAGPWTPAAPRAPGCRSRRCGASSWSRAGAPPTHVIEEAGVEELTAGGRAGRAVLASSPRGASRRSARRSCPSGRTRRRWRRRCSSAARGSCRAARRDGRRSAGVRAAGQADGRPLLGPLPGVEGVAVASGHGAWGVTLGPARPGSWPTGCSAAGGDPAGAARLGARCRW